MIFFIQKVKMLEKHDINTLISMNYIVYFYKNKVFLNLLILIKKLLFLIEIKQRNNTISLFGDFFKCFDLVKFNLKSNYVIETQ